MPLEKGRPHKFSEQFHISNRKTLWKWMYTVISAALIQSVIDAQKKNKHMHKDILSYSYIFNTTRLWNVHLKTVHIAVHLTPHAALLLLWYQQDIKASHSTLCLHALNRIQRLSRCKKQAHTQKQTQLKPLVCRGMTEGFHPTIKQKERKTLHYQSLQRWHHLVQSCISKWTIICQNKITL